MDARLILLATLVALGGAALVPVAAADVVAPVIVCDLEGHCICREVTVKAPVKLERHCTFA
jgi:hypothetical protein